MTTYEIAKKLVEKSTSPHRDKILASLETNAPWSDKVMAFHYMYNVPIGDSSGLEQMDNARIDLRLGLITEEYLHEYVPAVRDIDNIEIADALGDICYVIIGMLIEMGECPMVQATATELKTSTDMELAYDYGSVAFKTITRDRTSYISMLKMLDHTRAVAKSRKINLKEVFAEIHASNMTKLGEDGNPILREDGKVLKGPHYVKPDIAAALNR